MFQEENSSKPLFYTLGLRLISCLNWERFQPCSVKPYPASDISNCFDLLSLEELAALYQVLLYYHVTMAYNLWLAVGINFGTKSSCLMNHLRTLFPADKHTFSVDRGNSKQVKHGTSIAGFYLCSSQPIKEVQCASILSFYKSLM